MKKNKKKILIIIPHLDLGGGAEKIACLIGNNLNKKEFEPIILNFYKSKKENYEFNGKIISFNEKLTNNLIKNSIKLFSRGKKIKKICKKENISTTISFMEHANFSNVISKKIFKNKSKTIISVRNNPDKYKKDKIYNFLIKTLYPKADKIITLSKGVENNLQQNFNLKNTHTIYNSLDLKDAKKKLNEKLKESEKLKNKKFKFITIGRLNIQKGQKYLISTFKKVHDENPNTKLYFIGTGELKNELKKQVKELNLENSVFFLGNTNNVYKYLKQSDCFILSSLWEGFATVILEAMVAKLPIISTDANYGPKEIVSKQNPYNLNIKYPHKFEYGTITQNFINQTSTKEIEKIENNLKQVMLDIIKDKKIPNYSKRLDDFELKNIIKEWEKQI